MKQKKAVIAAVVVSGLMILACSGGMEKNGAEHPGSEGSEVQAGPIVEVFKYDGSVQCEEGAIPVELMMEELTRAGIEVLSWRKDHDGLVRTAVCGNPTGRVNVYGIAAADGRKALELGFNLFRTPKGTYN